MKNNSYSKIKYVKIGLSVAFIVSVFILGYFFFNVNEEVRDELIKC
jgi:hypothetical protein